MATNAGSSVPNPQPMASRVVHTAGSSGGACRFFATPAGCMLGAGCPFAHVQPSSLAPTTPSSVEVNAPSSSSSRSAQQQREPRPPSQQRQPHTQQPRPPREEGAQRKAPCRFFAAGSCRYGAGCKFAHGGDGVSDVAGGETPHAGGAVVSDGAQGNRRRNRPQRGEGAQAHRGDANNGAEDLGVGSTNTDAHEPAQSAGQAAASGTKRPSERRQNNRKQRAEQATGTAASPAVAPAPTAASSSPSPDAPLGPSTAPPAALAPAQQAGAQAQSASPRVAVPRRPPGSATGDHVRPAAPPPAPVTLESELAALSRRYPQSQTTKRAAQTDVAFTFAPSDPDWPFDVKAIKVNLVLPNTFPDAPFDVYFVDEAMPEMFRAHLNRTIRRHIAAEIAHAGDGGKCAGVRHFLRWLDKGMQDYFLEAGRSMRGELELESKGIKFVSADELKKKVASGAKEEEGEGVSEEKGTAFEKRDGDGAVRTQAQPGGVAGGSASAKGKERDAAPSATAAVPDERHLFDDARRVSESSEYGDDETSQSDDASGAGGSSSLFIDPASVRKGIEVRLGGLSLTNIAMVRPRSLLLVVACQRCRENSEIRLRPGVPSAGECGRCASEMSVSFLPSAAHEFSSLLAVAEPEGCTLAQLVVPECEFELQCYQCGAEKAGKDLAVVGGSRAHKCAGCHQEMRLGIESVQFHKVVPKETQGVGARGAAHKVPRRKVPNDPSIRPGFPLPDFGTCKHYKRSHRWLRFPCCNRAYPCDMCHEANKPDAHEMAWANRMICGFCSKEQSYSNKPCSCGGELVGGTSAQGYWEGGKGCRNQLAMNRKDAHKYSNSKLKTHSRKSERVGPKPPQPHGQGDG